MVHATPSGSVVTDADTEEMATLLLMELSRIREVEMSGTRYALMKLPYSSLTSPSLSVLSRSLL